MDQIVKKRLRQAVTALDPEDDALWDADGKPQPLAVYMWHRRGTRGRGTLADAEAVVASMPRYDREVARLGNHDLPPESQPE